MDWLVLLVVIVFLVVGAAALVAFDAERQRAEAETYELIRKVQDKFRRDYQ
jgi:hypothetical protein